MNKPLPLFEDAKPCIQSGYCCKQAVCPFGKWDQEKHQCTYLTEDNLCGQYDYILSLPKEQWELSPAFGAGCCSPLNSDRQEILRNRASSLYESPAGNSIT